MQFTYRWIIIFTVLSMLGCSTYVNIPKQLGDIASNSPNTPSVSAVTTEALRAVVEDRPIGQPFEVVLFHGTRRDNALAIVPKISRHAVWAGDTDQADLPQVVIHRLRIRDNKAWADITRPAHTNYPHSGDQLVTVHLEWTISGGWESTQVSAWRVDPSTALREQPLTYEQAHPDREMHQGRTSINKRRAASVIDYRTTDTYRAHASQSIGVEVKQSGGPANPTHVESQGFSNSSAVTPIDLSATK